MQSSQALSVDGPWLYNPIWLLALMGVTMGQGATGAVCLIALRHWRHGGGGSLTRWSQASWGAFLVAGLLFCVSSALPIPSWVTLPLNLGLYSAWLLRAARWAAQE